MKTAGHGKVRREPWVIGIAHGNYGLQRLDILGIRERVADQRLCARVMNKRRSRIRAVCTLPSDDVEYGSYKDVVSEQYATSGKNNLLHLPKNAHSMTFTEGLTNTALIPLAFPFLFAQNVISNDSAPPRH